MSKIQIFSLIAFMLLLTAPQAQAGGIFDQSGVKQGTQRPPGYLVQLEFEDYGFSFQYPEYWTVVTDVQDILDIQDGSIDLIREEEISQDELGSYVAMVHVAGSPEYLSNVTFLAREHGMGGNSHNSNEEILRELKDEFELHKASGTYFLEEQYLGNSHTYVYRRAIDIDEWRDRIRITYYITASRTRAYMLIETVLLSALNDIYSDEFNQVIQSFRATENESFGIDPGLNWGWFRPGESPGVGDDPGLDVGRAEIVEEFDSNRFRWPVGSDSRIHDGVYELDSRDGFPFTVLNDRLGRIRFDFTLEGKCRFVDGDENSGYGLVFGYRDEDNYFAFLVSSGGSFLVVKENDGQVTQLIPWTVPLDVRDGEHVLIVQGNYRSINDPDEPISDNMYELVFLIDGNEVGRLYIDEILDVSGEFGIFLSKDLLVEFDYLISRNYLVGGVMTLDRVVID